MSDTLQDDEVVEEVPTRAPPAAPGSTVWIASSRKGMTACVAGFGEHTDAIDWLDVQSGDEEQLFGLIVDCSHLMPEEIQRLLGVFEGSEPMPLAQDAVERFKADVSKGQFLEEFSGMTPEEQGRLAWQLRQNYQRLLGEIADVRETLGNLEGTAEVLGLQGDDADAFVALLSAQ